MTPTPTPLKPEDHIVRERFIALRDELGLSKPEFAHELGMTTRAVHFYEAGERVIPKHVQRMMDMLKREHELKKLVGASEVSA